MLYLIALIALLSGCSNKPVDLAKSQDNVITNVAKTAEQKHYYDYAIFLRKKYLEQHPNDSNTLKMLVADLQRANRWQESLAYLEKLPQNQQTQLSTANAYLHVKAWQLAYKKYAELIAQNPSTDALNGMGVILSSCKAYAEANKCFKKALAIQPNNANTLNNYALSLAMSGDKAQAIDILNNLALVHPSSAYSANLKKVKLAKSSNKLWNEFFDKKANSFKYSC